MMREGGVSGHLILETACNRSYFRNQSLKSAIYSGYYGKANKNTTKPHTDYTKRMIQKVIYNGSNDTNLASDQAYNDKSLFAKIFIDAGTTGSWYDLNKGTKITDPARVIQLSNNPGNGQQEYIYRKDGFGKDGSTPDGHKLKAYGKQYNIQPTDPSTFNSGTPLPPEIQNASKSDLTGQPLRTTTAENNPATVINTDNNGPTVVKNTNDMAKGLFTFPGIGAMVWVFFREGNPQFPVYFAASYSEGEWKSAYSGASLNADGTNNGSVGNQVSNSLKLNPNAGGGLEFTHIKDNTDPSGAHDKAVAMMYGDDGSNMLFSKGYHQIYTRHDRRDQIDGHRYKIVGGTEEQWIEEDSNTNVRGNLLIKVGKIDAETIEAMKQLSDFSKDINKMLLNNPPQA
jgi:hypothetical protein